MPSIEELHALLAKSFTPARPIDLPEFLTGRLDVLYRAIDASNTSGKHIILFGERGIGKTSIARVLAHNVQDAKPRGRRALLASCSTVDDYANIWSGAYQSHLAKFCSEDRGPILRRTGTPRAYRWQFIDPQIIPFIVIRGKEEGLLPD